MSALPPPHHVVFLQVTGGWGPFSLSRLVTKEFVGLLVRAQGRGGTGELCGLSPTCCKRTMQGLPPPLLRVCMCVCVCMCLCVERCEWWQWGGSLSLSWKPEAGGQRQTIPRPRGGSARPELSRLEMRPLLPPLPVPCPRSCRPGQHPSLLPSPHSSSKEALL